MEMKPDQLVAYVIGFNMHRIREARELSIKEVAEALKTAEDDIKAIETGEQLCSVTYTIRFIALFNIKFEELIECYDPIIENLFLHKYGKQEEIETLMFGPEPTMCFSK